MKKILLSVSVMFLFTAAALAQGQVCQKWETYTGHKGQVLTRCTSWAKLQQTPVVVEQPKADETQEECWETKDRFGNTYKRCVTKKLRTMCKLWETVEFKNGTRIATCKDILNTDRPAATEHIICHQWVTEPMPKEKLGKKQVNGWISECSKFDVKPNAFPCLHWQHQYKEDGTIVSNCQSYLDEGDPKPFARYTEYLGLSQKPENLIGDGVRHDGHLCGEFSFSKLNKQGQRTVTCTKFVVAVF